MEEQRISERIVAELPAPDTGYRITWFSGAKLDARRAPVGFGVRTTAATGGGAGEKRGGTKSFVLMHRSAKIGQYLETIGRWGSGQHRTGMAVAEAIRKANERAEAVRDGADPRPSRTRRIAQKKDAVAEAEKAKAAEALAAGTTFKAIFERFVAEALTLGQGQRRPARAATIRAYRWAVFLPDAKVAASTRSKPRGGAASELIRSWHDRPIASISEEDIKAALDAMIDRGVTTGANRTYAYLHKFFRWCERRRYVAASPMRHILKPAGEKARERELSGPEIVEVWNACGKEGGNIELVAKLCILDGQRPGEVAGLRWPELHGLKRDDKGKLIADPEAPRCVWELPGTRTKNHRAHTVPLTPEAIALIGRAKQGESELVFTNDGVASIEVGDKLKKAIDAHIAEAHAAAGINAPMPAWQWRDLRRTFESGVTRLGFTRFIADRITNHADNSVGGVHYDKYDYWTERERALLAWEDHVLGLLGKKKKASNVASLDEHRIAAGATL